MDIPALFFSTTGRIGRGQWWLGIVCITLVTLAIGWVLFVLMNTAMYYTIQGRGLVFFLTLIPIAASYCLNAKRFHDRNKTQAFAFAGFAVAGVKAVSDLFGLTGDPWGWNTGDNIFQIVQIAIGIWYLIELGCLRGTAGANDYGEAPVAQATATQ